jgi:hypothetical protein
MRPIFHATLMLALLFSCAVRAQPPPAAAAGNAFNLEPGASAVGFRLLEGEDRSRVVTGGVSATAHPRPVRTYLWYPAQGPRPMRFGRYAEPPTATSARRNQRKLARAPHCTARSPVRWARGLRRAAAAAMLAAENADPLKGRSMIVIGQGWSIEPAISLAALAEYLAGRGFVVAATPLVGTNSPIARVEAMDLENEVRDLEFAIARARELPFVSPDKLGVIGADMGGMAGLVLTMRNRDVDAFVGMPAGILFEHPSGLPRISPGYDPLALRVPWQKSEPVAAPAARVVNPSLFRRRCTPSALADPAMDYTDITIGRLIEGRSRIVRFRRQRPPGRGQKAIGPTCSSFSRRSSGRTRDSRAKRSSVSLAGAGRRKLEDDARRRWRCLRHHTSSSSKRWLPVGPAGDRSAPLEAAVEPDHVMLSQGRCSVSA